MKTRAILFLIIFIFIGFTSLARAVGQAGQKTADNAIILIKNVNIFNGIDEELIPDQDVMIKGNKIETVGKDITAPKRATVINGGGRTLTPGFIDNHTHLVWNLGVYEHFNTPIDYHAALALVDAKNTLMRGFTTIRDVGGSVWGVKRAIEEGYF